MSETVAFHRTLYAGWENYQRLVLAALRDLQPKQLALRPAPHEWAVWQIASHMAGTRAFWFHDFLGEGSNTVRDMFRVDTTTVADLPVEDAGWEDDETRPRTAAEIVDAFEQTWTMMDECLQRWTLDDLAVEFPRINDRREATPTRFVYLPTLTSSLKLPHVPSDTFNTMLKVDTATARVARHDFGNRIAGEAVFIPRNHRAGEDDGYLAIFAFDPVDRTSDFVLLDAARIDADPVAVVRLPQRVPQGLHGSWIPRA